MRRKYLLKLIVYEHSIAEQLEFILFNTIVKNADNPDRKAVFNGNSLAYMKEALQQAYNLGCKKRKKIPCQTNSKG